MLYAKFQNHMPSSSAEEAFKGHDGHLGYVTLTIHINFHSPFLRMLHTKFDFDWPCGFREEDL